MPDQVTARADIYALGVVLTELATGSPPAPVPFAGSPTGIAELDRVLGRCLPREPADRYESADALANELREIQVNVPSALDSSVILLEETARGQSRFNAAWAVTMLAPILLVVATLWFSGWVAPAREKALSSVAMNQVDSGVIADTAARGEPTSQQSAVDGENDAAESVAVSRQAEVLPTGDRIVISNPKWSDEMFQKYVRVDYELKTHIGIAMRLALVVEAANGQRHEEPVRGYDLGGKGTLRAQFHAFGNFPPPYEVFLENDEFGPGRNRARISNILQLPSQ
jgi:hypothetical protein